MATSILPPSGANVLSFPNAHAPALHPGQRPLRGKRPNIVTIAALAKRRADTIAAEAKALDEQKRSARQEKCSGEMEGHLCKAFWEMNFHDRGRLLDAACLAANLNGGASAWSKDGVRAEDRGIAGLLSKQENELVLLLRGCRPQFREGLCTMLNGSGSRI